MAAKTHAEIMPPLLQWLREIIPDASLKLDPETPLIAENLLDSMDLLRLVSWLEESFGISVDPDLLVPENFETPEKVVELALSIQAGA